MSILNGINNFLMLFYAHWTEIFVLIVLGFMTYNRVASYLSKSKEEKIAIAKEIIQQTMLARVSKAEKDYAEWSKSGMAKRAQVISSIYADFPILEKLIDQESLIAWIDEKINEALKKMCEMLEAK